MEDKTEITKYYEEVETHKCITLTFTSKENEEDEVCVQMTYTTKNLYDNREDKYASLLENFVEKVMGLENDYYLAKKTYLTKHLNKENEGNV